MSRNVVVTGGGTGIGRAIAARFAAAGDEVVITGRTRERIEAAAAELGHHVRAVVCDHSDVASVEALCRELPDVVHVLVNNAGGNPFFNRPVEGLDEIAAMWSYVFENNLLSSVLTTEALLARLAEGGALVHTGSTAMVGRGHAARRGEGRARGVERRPRRSRRPAAHRHERARAGVHA